MIAFMYLNPPLPPPKKPRGKPSFPKGFPRSLPQFIYKPPSHGFDLPDMRGAGIGGGSK